MKLALQIPEHQPIVDLRVDQDWPTLRALDMVRGSQACEGTGNFIFGYSKCLVPPIEWSHRTASIAGHGYAPPSAMLRSVPINRSATIGTVSMRRRSSTVWTPSSVGPMEMASMAG